MALEDRVQTRIKDLIRESERLSVGNENGQSVDEHRRGECSAWLTSALNIVHIVCQSPTSPYRQKADAVATKEWGYIIHVGVAELGAVLRNLLWDSDAGLLASVADQARAETFDDFLDHADAYVAMRNGRSSICPTSKQPLHSRESSSLPIWMRRSNPSIERTFQRPLRALWPAAHVER